MTQRAGVDLLLRRLEHAWRCMEVAGFAHEQEACVEIIRTELMLRWAGTPGATREEAWEILGIQQEYPFSAWSFCALLSLTELLRRTLNTKGHRKRDRAEAVTGPVSHKKRK